MNINRRLPLVLPLVIAAAIAAPAFAQQPPATQPPPPVPPAAPAAAKKPHQPKPAPAGATASPAATAAALAAGAKPTLLGQYGEWGAYGAMPNGKKVCFTIAKPSTSETNPPNRPRNPTYMFISSRPAEKVSNELSIIIGYPFKSSAEATVEIGPASFVLYTQQDGAWIKNAAEEARVVEAMRAGQSAIVKGTSTKGTKSIDTFSLKGLAQALDRTDKDCK
jgi:Invasion associated locus B (IalB) protein